MDKFTEIQSVTFAPETIEGLTQDAAIDAALVFVKWNEIPEAFRILAIWGKANGENPYWLARIEVRAIGGVGASRLLQRAFHLRKDPSEPYSAALGKDWFDTWTSPW